MIELWHESGTEWRKFFDVPVLLSDAIVEHTRWVHDIDQLDLYLIAITVDIDNVLELAIDWTMIRALQLSQQTSRLARGIILTKSPSWMSAWTNHSRIEPLARTKSMRLPKFPGLALIFCSQ